MIRIQRFSSSDLIVLMVCALLMLFFYIATAPQIASPSKPRSYMSNCTANLKQLGNAASLYEGDNAGIRPGPQPFGKENVLVSWDRPLAIQIGAELGSAGIQEPLANLIKIPPHAAARSLAIFTCPVDQQKEGACLVPAVPGSWADGLAAGKGICRSYTLNLGSGTLDGPDEGIAPAANAIPLKRVKTAAGTVFLIENHGYATVFGQRNIANDTTLACSRKGHVIPAAAFTNPAVPVHGTKKNPRVNALMYDGHVEVLDQGSITANGGGVMQYAREEGKKSVPATPPSEEPAK